MEELYQAIGKKKFVKKIELIHKSITKEEVVEALEFCAEFGKYLQDQFPQADTPFILNKIEKNPFFLEIMEDEKDLFFSNNLHEAIVDLYRQYLSDMDDIEEDKTTEKNIKKNLAKQLTNTLQMAKLGLESYLKLIRTQLENIEAPDRFDESRFQIIRKAINEKVENNSKFINSLIIEFDHYKKHLSLIKNHPSETLNQHQQFASELIHLLNDNSLTQREILENISRKMITQGETLSKPIQSSSRFYAKFFKPVFHTFKCVPLIDQLFKTQGELLIDKIDTLIRKL